jgi:hypothetical protein
MFNELISKDVDGSGGGLSEVLPCPSKTRENHKKIISQDSWCSGSDSNRALTKQKLLSISVFYH